MNTNKNWTRVAWFFVLALTSLSSTAVVAAASVPHRDHLDVYAAPLAADLCGVSNVSRFDQYSAAITWAEQGGELPFALTVSCVEESPDLAASFAGYGGESWARFEQYMAAIEGRASTLDAAPARTATGSQARFEQYMAAIEWSEQGGPAPEALTANYGAESVGDSDLSAGYGGESWARFEQYMAAIGQE